MSQVTLGISAFYHDSAATLLIDGEIFGAVQEERFTRIKNDESFPLKSIEFLLNDAGLALSDVDIISFYDKPFLKFERLLETYHKFAPFGLKSFLKAMPIWTKEKLFIQKMIWKELENLTTYEKSLSKKIKLFFPEHHLSHSASAFYPSPFQDAAILTVDGVGEWATTTISRGDNTGIEVIKELHFPHSLGLLYSAFTYYCGFKVNSGEYKLMGLAPYGIKNSKRVNFYKDCILNNLIHLKEDGSLHLDMDYFDFATGLKMCKDKAWEKLFKIAKRKPESHIDQEYMDLALAIQEITEDIILKLAKTAKELTGQKNLVLAGGVALNCVANGLLVKERIFENVWVQPAAGDAGGALGAAYIAYHLSESPQLKELPVGQFDHMKGSFLGPSFTEKDVQRLCRKVKASPKKFSSHELLCTEVAKLISADKVVGWFQGAMEWGPRALGNRSILGNPSSNDMQRRLNLKIKYRESFRPFAPAVLYEDMQEFFDLDVVSQYMTLVAPVKKEIRDETPENYDKLEMLERLKIKRSSLPAITHIDFSARVQSVHEETNPKFTMLLRALKKETGKGVVINTSFNVRGEPIVCTPEDAYNCFLKTEMDYLVIENFLFEKLSSI